MRLLAELKKVWGQRIFALCLAVLAAANLFLLYTGTRPGENSAQPAAWRAAARDLAGLDPKERVRLRSLLAELARDRIILVATHVVSDVETVATEILLLKNGKLVDQAPVSELIAAHAPGQNLEAVYLSVFGEEDGK